MINVNDHEQDGDGLYVYRKKDGTYQLHHKIGVTAFPGGVIMHDAYAFGTAP